MKTLSGRADGRGRLAWDAAQLWGSALVEQILAMIRGVILPRLLGPGMYGVLGGLGLITKYGSYLQLGLTTAVAREVPHALGEGDEGRARRIERAVFSFNLLTSLLPAMALIGYTGLTWGKYRAEVSWGLVVFALLLVTGRFDVFFTTLFRSRMKFTASFWYTVLKTATSFALVVGLVFPFRLAGVYGGLVLSGVVFWAVGAMWTRTWAGPWPAWGVIKELLPVGLPLAGIGVLGFVLQSLDRLLLIRFRPATDLGYYSLAVTVVTFIYFVPMNVGQAMAPRIFRLPREGDRRAFREYLVQPTLVVTYLVALIGGVALLAFIPFVRYVLPAYGPSVSIVAALLVGITCQGGAQGGAHILVALGRFKTIAAGQLVAIVVAGGGALAALSGGRSLWPVALSSSAGLVVYASILQFYACRAIGFSAGGFAKAMGYLWLPAAAVAGALAGAFYGASKIAAAITVPPVGLGADLLILALRLLLFVPVALLFGWYVERETGAAGIALSKLRERFRP